VFSTAWRGITGHSSCGPRSCCSSSSSSLSCSGARAVPSRTFTRSSSSTFRPSRRRSYWKGHLLACPQQRSSRLPRTPSSSSPKRLAFLLARCHEKKKKIHFLYISFVSKNNTFVPQASLLFFSLVDLFIGPRQCRRTRRLLASSPPPPPRRRRPRLSFVDVRWGRAFSAPGR